MFQFLTKCLALVCALTLIVGCVAVSSASASASSDIPTITFVTQENSSTQALAAQINAYKAYIAGVKDKYNVVFDNSATGDALKSKMRTLMASDSFPDVFWYWGQASDSSDFVHSGLVLNVKDFFAVSDLNFDDFENWDSMYCYEGEYYAIPIAYSQMGWMANTEIFDRLNLPIPKTVQEIIDMAPTLRANGIIPIATGSKGGNPSHTLIDMFYCQLPGSDEELKNIIPTSTLDTPNLRKTLELIDEMRLAGCFPDDTVTNGGWDPAVALYDMGLAALCPTLNSRVTGLSEESVARTVFIDCPTVEGGILDMSQIALACGLNSLQISKKAWEDPTKQAAIRDWVEFYLSDAMVQSRFVYSAYIPTKKGVTVDYTFVEKSIPMFKKMLDQNEGKQILNVMSHCTSIPNATVWADYQAELDGFFAGVLTVDEFIERIQASITANP
jgi:raffinose/stachyose/melibiose transport system substrate-binding protein